MKFTHLINIYKNRYTKAYKMKYMHCCWPMDSSVSEHYYCVALLWVA
ncbi:MAG: hypothetical protein ACI87J_002455 [Colwellia sp.]